MVSPPPSDPPHPNQSKGFTVSKPKQVKKSSPSSSQRAKPAPGTKTPVKGDHSMDKVLSAPKRPTVGPLTAQPKYLTEMPGHLLVEELPAPSSLKPANTGTGTPSKGRRK